jgi:Protein of unknown function (DUF1822)
MMMNLPTDDLEDSLDWQFLNETQTELLPEHLQRAADLSMLIKLSQQRWQTYLSALATLGFEEWLKERAPDLKINSNSSSIWQPEYANLLSAACNIEVGNFKVCLITVSNLTEEHSVPFAAFDIPELTAHFYVLIQVEEEQQQVAVSGFMSYEQYQQYRQTAGLQVESDWTYTLPSTCFNPNPDALLLNLRCLEASSIQLPVGIPKIKTDTVKALQQKLTTLQSQLQTQYIWKLLTVAEGVTLLNSPDLMNLIYIETRNDPAGSPKEYASQDSVLSTQPAVSIEASLINVGLWLQNQIDTAARELGWMLMPAFSQLRLSSELRSLEDFDDIRAGLEQQGVHIPLLARGAYRDLECESGSLRLYAIMWLLSETDENPEWMLLVTLGSQPQANMPEIVNLNIRDETQVLFAGTLEDTNHGILYAQVIGNLGEQFWVTVTADNAVFEIPPFGLELERIS